jgi:flagellar hook capping protein
MAQMTQMAMVQSLGTMTTNMKQEMALTKTSYLAGLIGKDVSAKVPEAEQKANPNAPKEKSGVIASVNLTGDEPSFRLQGDVTDYPLESLLMVRQAGAASESSTTGSAVTATGASTGTTAPGASTTAPGAISSTGSSTASPSAATAGSATPAAAASTAGASTAGTTGSASTASPATGSASTASPATGSASASSTTGTVSTAGTATTATTGTAAGANPAGSSVPPAVASSSASSSEFGPHVAILEREAAAHSASN